MRKKASYVKKYGQKNGEKLYCLLQQEANKASQVAKFKKKIERESEPSTARVPKLLSEPFTERAPRDLCEPSKLRAPKTESVSRSPREHRVLRAKRFLQND